MHRPYYHNDEPYMAKAEVCKECSHDNVLVPVSFCPEAMKYLVAEDRLDNLITEWHGEAGLGQELHEYIGWTKKEFARWVEDYEIPEHFLNEKEDDSSL